MCLYACFSAAVTATRFVTTGKRFWSIPSKMTQSLIQNSMRSQCVQQWYRPSDLQFSKSINSSGLLPSGEKVWKTRALPGSTKRCEGFGSCGIRLTRNYFVGDSALRQMPTLLPDERPNVEFFSPD